MSSKGNNKPKPDPRLRETIRKTFRPKKVIQESKESK